MADMGTKQAAEKWGVSQATVAKWCRNKQISGATQNKKGSTWHIPKNTKPPSRQIYKKC